MTTRRLACAALLVTTCAAWTTGTAAAAEKPPRVLLIGDSIAGYYRPYVKQLLKDRVTIAYSGNASDTRYGLAHIDRWLEAHTPELIHFNWGLHDVKPVKGRRNNVPVEEYVKNLRELVRRMKKTGATLVWATTTPVGPLAARRNSHVIRYNAAALKVMKAEGIAINDLYALAAPIRERIQYKDNVHFKPYYKDPPPENDEENGCKILGKAVARKILEVLKGGKGERRPRNR